MTTEPLPAFRYHPDPLATGSVEARDTVCVACGRARGVVYVGPVYADDELDDRLCPWCIADGTAANRYGAEFTDVGLGVPDDVPSDVLVEVSQRTPGFAGWQQEHWLYHCGDAAAFLGPAGAKGVEHLPDALEALREEGLESDWSDDDIEEYIGSLDKKSGPTAYLFRCLHCDRHLAYSDFA